MNFPIDQRPLIVAVAGPNGAGKTTFYHSHLKPAGLRFINADVLALELDMPSVAVYEQARRIFEGKPAPKWLRRILKDGPGK